jgi:putative ABC transport system permease protein
MALPLSYNVRNLRQRWQVTLLAILGISLVVAVVIVLLAMLAGFRTALRSTGLAGNAMVVQRGSQGELTSWVSLAHRNLIVVDDRVARGEDGQPLASPEIVVVANLPRASDGQVTNVTLRGVTPRAFSVRGGIEIASGRNFTPGLFEIIVGERIAGRVRGVLVGKSVRIQRQDWQVVGIFRSQGSGFESEFWGDIDVMGPAFLRTGGSSSLVVRLKDEGTVADLDRTIRADPQMQLQAIDERKYYADQAGPISAVLIGLTAFVAIIMGIGAVFGAMNTMYAIVASRTREIGTLRALGFSRRSILLSFVLESVFLALLGGLVGIALALPANKLGAATGIGFAELAFAFKVTPSAMGIGLAFAGAMGLAGGLLPALRAARLPITRALREA